MDTHILLHATGVRAVIGVFDLFTPAPGKLADLHTRTRKTGLTPENLFRLSSHAAHLQDPRKNGVGNIFPPRKLGGRSNTQLVVIAGAGTLTFGSPDIRIP